MKSSPKEQITITTLASTGHEDRIFVTEGHKQKASSKFSSAIHESSALRLENLRISPTSLKLRLSAFLVKHKILKPRSLEPLLWCSAFHPCEDSIICQAHHALIGELEDIKLYRILLERYYILFDFYNERSGRLSRLQPSNARLRSFRVRCNDSVYYVRFKWNRREERTVVDVRVKRDNEIFYHKQPLYAEDIGDCIEEYE